jgi:hypothetical protein
MAEYRSGRYPAADQALAAADNPSSPWVFSKAARLFRAMSLFQQGRKEEAQKLFAETEAQMAPLPADESQPLADGAEVNDIVVWLAYKEAKALFQPETPPRPHKADEQ